jgi:tRNA(Ile)-lysidine synthase
MPPAVAATRLAVRDGLAEVPAGSLVLVACSGGPDSLALAAAAGFVCPRAGLRAGLVTVDHGLQDGSADRAAAVVRWATAAGLAPAEVATVSVGTAGGPEAAARTARYGALDAAADRLHATAVLLGHTRDDQAETVLLALARGAGPRGLAGMPVRRGRYLRPFLALPRSVPAAACAELGLTPWHDPHNTDPAYARSRLRAAMDTLESLLGNGFTANLARTAELVAADTALLDVQAATLLADADTGAGLDAAVLAAAPTALRTRVLHAHARRLGVPGTDLTAGHVAALDALLTRWHGQGPVHLPGNITIRRTHGALISERTKPGGTGASRG